MTRCIFRRKWLQIGSALGILLLGWPSGDAAEADLSAVVEERFIQLSQLLDEELAGSADQLKAFLEGAHTAFLSGNVPAVQQNVNILMTAILSVSELGQDLGLLDALGTERLRLGLALLADALVLALPDTGPLQIGLYVAERDAEEVVERVVGPFLGDCPQQLTLRGPQEELQFERRTCEPILPESGSR